MASKKHPAKIQNGGRVSIDADVRRELELEQGDYVMIDVETLEGSE
jgi:bifunctional DNA-binding transcriptional regulator/antitoxin component of YhaV-PrlF toxin-antitoxin module